MDSGLQESNFLIHEGCSAAIDGSLSDPDHVGECVSFQLADLCTTRSMGPIPTLLISEPLLPYINRDPSKDGERRF